MRTRICPEDVRLPAFEELSKGATEAYKLFQQELTLGKDLSRLKEMTSIRLYEHILEERTHDLSNFEEIREKYGEDEDGSIRYESCESFLTNVDIDQNEQEIERAIREEDEEVLNSLKHRVRGYRLHFTFFTKQSAPWIETNDGIGERIDTLVFDAHAVDGGEDLSDWVIETIE